jgi:heptosyltransferase III
MPGIDKRKIHHILISRIDAIGDVVLTLPMCGYLKLIFPHSKVSFLGRTYTKPVVSACTAVDSFINYDEIKRLPEDEQVNYFKNEKIDTILHVFPNKAVALLAKRAGIKTRIGTTNRIYHWITCNQLVLLSRKNSDLHEAQLNLILLEAFGFDQTPSLHDIADHYNFKPATQLPSHLKELLSDKKFNLILHPKSHGSGKEWSIVNFSNLIAQLPGDKFNLIITGSEKEKHLIEEWISALPKHVIDLTGKMSLDELISFIFNADGLLASGTGPLHLAAASGIHALGLFPPSRPIHPGRWAPLGKKAEYLESKSDDLDDISVDMVCEKINSWYGE